MGDKLTEQNYIFVVNHRHIDEKRGQNAWMTSIATF
ncbi:MAG: hypothetical protein RL128_1265 [Pseudomonadota bacterium]|jgi:hypothetical protein